MTGAIVAVFTATGLMLLAGWVLLVVSYCRKTRVPVQATMVLKRPLDSRPEHNEWR